MSFLYPTFLYALAAVAIPIIIHLFNFQRYKTVLFTNVRFLKEVKQQTKQQAQLKHLLVLLARILFIVFLVLAFAQPFIPVTEQASGTGNAVSIFLDNSLSMDATNEDGRLFDQARNSVAEIVAAYKPTDRFQLLTNDFEARHQQFINGEELKEQVDQIDISPAVKPLSQIIARQRDLLSNNAEANRHSYILSDFQKQNTDFENISSDTSMIVRMVPLTPQDKNNIYIDSCWFDTPVRETDKPERLMARIVNDSDIDYENLPVKLMVNNQQKALANCSVNSHSFTVIELNFQLSSPGIKHCLVSLTDYPVTFDDTYYLSYRITENIVVTSIYDSTANQFIQSFYGNDPHFTLHNEADKQIDYSKLGSNHLIILNELEDISTGLAQELGKFTKNGGTLIIFPGPNSNLTAYAELLANVLGINMLKGKDTVSTKAMILNLHHRIFNDVFEKIPERINLPQVYTHYTLDQSAQGEMEHLITLENGDPLVSEHKSGKGSVFLFTIPLAMEFSNLPEHALFVPLAYNMAIQSQVGENHAYTIGKDRIIQVPLLNLKETGHIYHLTNWSSLKNLEDFDIIPEFHIRRQYANITVHAAVQEAGNYELVTDKEPLAGISFNYDRRESGLSCHDADMLEDLAHQFNLSTFSVIQGKGQLFAHSLSELNEGKKLWKLCIIFALAFLGIEILLLRFWK